MFFTARTSVAMTPSTPTKAAVVLCRKSRRRLAIFSCSAAARALAFPRLRAAALVGRRPLVLSELRQLAFQVPRVLDLDLLAGVEGERGERLNAPVQARGHSAMPSLRCALDRHRGVPAPVPPRDLAGLGLPLVPGLAAHLHEPDARQAKLTVPPPIAGHEPPAVAVGLVPPAAEALERLEAREARGVSLPHAPEERLEREVESLEGNLRALRVHGCERLVLASERGEFAALGGEADRHPLAGPGFPALLERGVVQLLVEP